MGKDNQMPFMDWLNQVNTANSDISIFFGGMPEMDYGQLKKKEFKNICFRNIYVRLLNIALSLFKWTLPETMDERVIEIGYLLRGSICVCKVKEGTFALPCTPNNMYNIYGNPTQARAMALNGQQWTVNVKYTTDIPHREEGDAFFSEAIGDAVYSRDNKLAYPYITYIREYAYKITDGLIAKNIAAQRLKSPFTYVVNEIELKDTVQRIVEKIESNDDVIIRVKNPGVKGNGLEDQVKMEPNPMKPEIVKAIEDSILFDFNMFLETVGINTNPSPDKSQVVLTSEVNSNNGLIELEKDIRFKNREKLCEDVKKIFGIEMKVEHNVEETQLLVDQFRKDIKGNDNSGKQKEAG